MSFLLHFIFLSFRSNSIAIVPSDSFRRSKAANEILLSGNSGVNSNGAIIIRNESELHRSSSTTNVGINRPGRPLAGSMLTRMTNYPSSVNK